MKNGNLDENRVFRHMVDILNASLNTVSKSKSHMENLKKKKETINKEQKAKNNFPIQQCLVIYCEMREEKIIGG